MLCLLLIGWRLASSRREEAVSVISPAPYFSNRGDRRGSFEIYWVQVAQRTIFAQCVNDDGAATAVWGWDVRNDVEHERVDEIGPNVRIGECSLLDYF